MRRIASIILLVMMLFSYSSAIATESLGPITLDYFGLHIHRADQGTAWPNVSFGSWRLWDAYVGWAQLEPELGKWDFRRLDRYVAMATVAKVDLLLPLAMTPHWAAARPNEPCAYKPGNASEPARIEDWRRYVRTVGQRYKGRIRHYEIWNEPSDKSHYTGSIDTLVRLTCEANKILKEIDPANRIVSPSSAGGGRHIEYLDNFLAAGGKNCIDIVGHHFYVFRDGPEAMVPLIRRVRAVMRKHGIEHKPLWNTETGWWIANGDGTPDNQMVAKGGWRKLGLEKESGDVLFRAFVLARAEGVERFYWYAWDNHSLGLIEPTSKKPKPVVKRWQAMVEQLLGVTINSCVSVGSQWTCQTQDLSGKDGIVSWKAE